MSKLHFAPGIANTPGLHTHQRHGLHVSTPPAARPLPRPATPPPMNAQRSALIQRLMAIHPFPERALERLQTHQLMALCEVCDQPPEAPDVLGEVVRLQQAQRQGQPLYTAAAPPPRRHVPPPPCRHCSQHRCQCAVPEPPDVLGECVRIHREQGRGR
jgi:hypothetical protein